MAALFHGGARGGDELERPITINGEALEVVEEFKYLGSVISADGTDKEDLRQRIGRAWGAFYNLGQTLLERRMGIKLRGRILYTSVVAVLLHGCEHWRLTRQMEADLVKAHHGMQLGLLRLTRKAAAERHITRAEARLRTGAHDILGLLEKRKIKRGTKLMQVHRSAPSLPSILLAGEPAMLRYPVARGATGIKFWRRDGTRGAPLHWEAQWLELLDTCLEPPGRVGGLTDALVLEEGYSKLATRPMEIRAKALARCLQCGIMQKSEQERQLHIMRVHGGAPDQDDNSTQRQGAPEAAGGAGEGGRDNTTTTNTNTNTIYSNNDNSSANSDNNTNTNNNDHGAGDDGSNRRRSGRSPYRLRSQTAASQHNEREQQGQEGEQQRGGAGGAAAQQQQQQQRQQQQQQVEEDEQGGAAPSHSYFLRSRR